MTDIKNETDYRNIPREMLDRNIPAGRGMVKWRVRYATRTIRNYPSIHD